MTHKCFNVHCIYLNVVSSHCLESFSGLRHHSSDHLPVFLSNNYNYIQYILMSVLVQRCRNKDACVCVSLPSLPYGKVFPFAWKKMRNFSSMWIYFADISPGQLVMFLLEGICRVCGGEKRLTDQTFHCEGETEKKSYKTKLNSSLTLKERKPWFKQEPSFSRLSGTKEKKSFQWFTVMPTHCAPSIVIKFFHEMCCSSAQMYQDILRKTDRKTNEELKTELIELKYCRNHIYQ